MKPQYFPYSSRPARSGVALILVLAFILLLSGIIVAFFSRSMSDRQVSGSSLNGIRADIFADASTQAIIADLQKEIIDGSVEKSTDPSKYHFYLPNPNYSTDVTKQAIVPFRVGNQDTTGKEYPNLVKRSLYGANGAFYKDSAINRAANVSSLNPALNGRYVSPTRWNRPLLLPMASPAPAAPDLTPKNFVTQSYSPGQSFKTGVTAAPDWILVTSLGTNGTNMTKTGNSIDTVNKVGEQDPVVGRYAYEIYDEGGLLDANVAGYPSGLNTKVAGVPNFAPNYKNNLTFADLTQIPGFTTNANAGKMIDSLLKYRNYADLQQTNALIGTTATFTPTQLLGYYNAVVNFAGFTSNDYNSPISSQQSNHAFPTRQDLIRFFTYAMPTAAADRADAQTALQYFGTFSRDLDEPSYVRAQSKDASAPGYDKTTPRILQNGANGGGGNNAFGGELAINPAFPTVRVTAAFPRNDGSTAVVGEPLVTSRFALSRLAWITYQGPSREHITDPIGVALKKQGVSDDMLKRGTKDNIYKYFGIIWDSSNHRWVYDHTSVNTPGSAPTQPNPAGIRTLSNILGREPDFFELLKASLLAGSLGKHGSLGMTSGATQPVRENTMVQYIRDIQIDMQIYNIGLNIIDQADPDSYPTRMIVYNNGITNTPSYRELFGVENLPYFHRFRNGVVRIKEASSGNKPQSVADNGNTDKTGVAALLLYPEIWNPHASNSSATGIDPATNTSFSGLGPTNFQATASSIDPDDHAELDKPIQIAQDLTSDNLRILPTDVPSPALYVPSTLKNSALQFQIPSGASYVNLFREPTVLIKPNLPSGSNLKAIWPDTTYIIGGGITASTNPGSPISNSAPSQAGQKYYAGSLTGTGPYLGIMLGRAPLQYYRQNGGYAATQALQARYVSGRCMALTMRLQYQDMWNNWVTYNEVFPPMLRQIGVNFLVADNNATFITETFDPRTARFGLFQHEGNNPAATIDVNGISQTNRTNGTGDAGRGFANSNFGYGVPQTGGLPSRPASGWFGSTDNSGWSDASFPMISALTCQNDASLNVFGQTFYADPDGVIRRATGAWMSTAGADVGNPMKTANQQSRPIVLNRAFRGVAELGYAFRDEPWKELDFFTPESGDTALLDTFCVNESSNTNHLVAGKVNLNTRQQAVLNAIVSGSYKDELNAQSVPGALASLNSSETGNITSAFITWTTAAPTADLPSVIGKWSKLVPLDQTVAGNKDNTGLGYGIKGKDSYLGFTSQLTSAAFVSSPLPSWNIQRLHSSVTRGILANGQTRVWNLMVDLIAQTGRYPSSANTLDKFAIEGEQRFWVHLAIDRLTGKVLDKQIEVVKE